MGSSAHFRVYLLPGICVLSRMFHWVSFCAKDTFLPTETKRVSVYLVKLWPKELLSLLYQWRRVRWEMLWNIFGTIVRYYVTCGWVVLWLHPKFFYVLGFHSLAFDIHIVVSMSYSFHIHFIIHLIFISWWVCHIHFIFTLFHYSFHIHTFLKCVTYISNFSELVLSIYTFSY